MSMRVADISASMICPGVISIGMPRPGVEGRGGELAVVASSEGETGRVGRETVMGMEEVEEEELVLTVM